MAGDAGSSYSPPPPFPYRPFLALIFLCSRYETAFRFCRYKNAQMIYSAFRHVPQLDEVLRTATGPASTRSGGAGNGARAPPPDGGKKGVAVTPIPPIKWWQETIEAAWKQGQSLGGVQALLGPVIKRKRTDATVAS
jgi:hypothetical protein